MQVEAVQKDLAKAHTALENQQSANSKIKLQNKSLEEKVAALSAELEDTSARLSSESDVASNMKNQLDELKMEYIAAGDKLEEEQVSTLSTRSMHVQVTLTETKY
jgi:septal ring factor EnvC (AmiA/AmiB activator)